MRFGALMAEVGAGMGLVVESVRLGSGGEGPEILGVCEDSRKVKAGDLFVARGGTKVSGAAYARDAVAKGAVAVVVERGLGSDFGELSRAGVGGQLGDEVAVATVNDANLAAALLAHAVAGWPARGMKVVGVTGTKGKTTVAYLLRSVLRAAGHRVGMIGTVEIDFGGAGGGGQDAGATGGGGQDARDTTGGQDARVTTGGGQDARDTVPAEMTTPSAVELVGMLARMRANGVTHCVMEVSSHALHQKRVAGIDFAVGIFTNLTGDHLDYHGTMEEYAAAKALLFEGLKEGAVAVVNADDKWCERMVRGCKARVTYYRTIADAEKVSSADGWVGRIIHLSTAGMFVDITEPNGVTLHFRHGGLIGRHNAANVLATCAAATALGLKSNKLLHKMKRIGPPPGRLQSVWVGTTDQSLMSELTWGIKDVRQPQKFAVFVDYAHTHDALENVLVTLRATMQGETNDALQAATVSKPLPRLICVFGCGGDRDRTKRPKMGAVAERLADVVIVTSDNPRTEEPGGIIEEVCAGFSAEVRGRLQRARGTADEGVGTTGGQDARVTVEPDRRAAIQRAIRMARAGDVVLLAGKGHENYQIIGTTKHHFDDVEEAEAALRANLELDSVKFRRITREAKREKSTN